ncbi:hypothetical protein Tco_0466554 [Tanacetum coccineum]
MNRVGSTEPLEKSLEIRNEDNISIQRTLHFRMQSSHPFGRHEHVIVEAAIALEKKICIASNLATESEWNSSKSIPSS